MAECIHGFDDGLCDVCFPRRPEPVRPVRAASGPRAPRAGVSRAAPSAPPTLRLPGRRVFHVTHLRTLESIALDGALRADAAPDVDVSSATTRELRSSATVPDGRSVASLVAFALAQDSTRFAELREGAAGGHWSDAARAAKPAEFVILAVPVDALGADLVLSDGDAAASTTRFAEGLEAGTSALRRLHAADPDFRDAELLVPGPVPLDAVAIVTVANERVRDAVRATFAAAGRPAPRVAVFPPVFQPS